MQRSWGRRRGRCMSLTGKARRILPAPPLLCQLPRGGVLILLPEGLSDFQDPAPWLDQRRRVGGGGGQSSQQAQKPRGSQRMGRVGLSGRRGSRRAPRGPRHSPSLPLRLSLLVNSAYFTAHCSGGNWNEAELQAAGKVPAAMEGLLSECCPLRAVRAASPALTPPTRVSVPGARGLSGVWGQ